MAERRRVAVAGVDDRVVGELVEEFGGDALVQGGEFIGGVRLSDPAGEERIAAEDVGGAFIGGVDEANRAGGVADEADDG